MFNRFPVNTLLCWPADPPPGAGVRPWSHEDEGERGSVDGTAESSGSTAVRGSHRPSLLYVVKQLELAVRSHLDGIVATAGITALQYTALTVLDHHDGLSLAQLARNSFVTPQSVADLVANLERNGLVRRDRNPQNRRELVVSLTPRGRKLLATYAHAVAELEATMTAGLTPEQISALSDAAVDCMGA